MTLNFVVIMTDDQGRWAMPHRMPELEMPHLARFLEDSLELDNFYCASPVCSPSRASVLTGRMPSAHGVHDWLIGQRHPDAKPDHYLAGQPTTAEVLAEAGYRCGMVGKWHLGDARTPAPGFEWWYAHRFGGGPYVGAPTWRDGEATSEPRYFTHAVTEEALAFLAEQDGQQPFYLQVNYTAPHDPWLEGHPEEYVERYADCRFDSVPREEPHPWVEPRKADFADAFADPEPHLRGYCASLSAVDAGLGEILDTLQKSDLLEKTVVIYMSDNGFACGHHGVWGKGNGTYPLNFWDNSVRVPCVIRVPHGARGVSKALVSATSIHPTICELAGVDLPADCWLAADSVADLLTEGDGEGGADVVVLFSEYGGGRMVTDGRWKLVERHEGPRELYDLVCDPDERNNLADCVEVRDVQSKLLQQLEQWFERHERPGYRAYDRAVQGYGQVHPLSRGLSDQRTYMGHPASLDGVRSK